MQENVALLNDLLKELNEKVDPVCDFCKDTAIGLEERERSNNYMKGKMNELFVAIKSLERNLQASPSTTKMNSKLSAVR